MSDSADVDAELAASDASFVAAAQGCLRHWDSAVPIEVAEEETGKIHHLFSIGGSQSEPGEGSSTIHIATSANPSTLR